MEAPARRGRRGLTVAFVALLLVVSGSVLRPTGRLTDHPGPSDDERVLRNLLSRYAAGDSDALSDLISRSADWSRRALDTTLARTKRALKETQSSVAARERTDLHARRLRADQLRLMWLCAVINLDASRHLSETELIGAHMLEADRVVGLLHAQQGDTTTFGPVPWPVDVAVSPIEEGEDAPVETMINREDIDALIRLWFGAMVARLQELVEVGLAPDVISRGLTWYPDHAELLLARGSAAETALAFGRLDDSLAESIYPRDVRTRWSRMLTAADEDYRHAFRLDATLTEALVRCGRVRLLSGDGAGAQALFDRADTDGAPSRTRYLARLFRARRAEQDGRLADAQVDYLRALELEPQARAPMLGLARNFDSAGDVAAARSWTSQTLDAHASTTDPWQEYVKGQAWQLDERMARLRSGKAR